MANASLTYVDPRSTRFGGFLTGTVALAAALLANPWIALVLALVLLGAAVGGPAWNLWAYAWRYSLARRIGKPEYLEPAAPPRFANLLGGVFVAAGLGFLWAGLTLWGQVFVGLVSGLAYLNAFANFCLGCRLYGLLLRPKTAPVAP